MEKIYLIEDINDLRYVGRTKRKYLCQRLAEHQRDKKTGKYVSSSGLNLYNCSISLLEECSTEEARDRERFWINKIDCVNHRRDNNKIEYVCYDKKNDRWRYNKTINKKRHCKSFNTEQEAIEYKKMYEVSLQ
jgi:hypothetical protein